MKSSSLTAIVDKHRPDQAPYEDLYRHLHANPELSTLEKETAQLIADRLSKLSSDLEIRKNIGGHGLVAILKNGPGKTVLLRADFDALPVAEKTGLPYASKKTMEDVDGIVKPVMHACGHDMHVTSLIAAAELLLSARSTWSGTCIFLFQPAEEKGAGAQAMVDDGLYDESKHGCPIPDVVLGQHVMPVPAGCVGTRQGTFMSAADNFKITIFGRGGHGSMPHHCIDPVVIASHLVVRLQTIVSREVPPDETAVITVGAFQAGSAENIISAEAVLKVTIRSVTEQWRKHILASVHRVVHAECTASNCPKPPTIEPLSSFPLTVNDSSLTSTLDATFAAHFGSSRHLPNFQRVLGSEDFGILGTSVDRPYCYWLFGGVGQAEWDEREEKGTLTEVPVNHSPFFAPVVQPTLATGMEALAVAALTFLVKSSEG